ncbi:MAG: hypothetical protein AAF125_08045 [Chloroflexota bacterium]
MTSSRISYHVHATFLVDRTRLREHVAAIRPHFLLVSGNPVDVATELQQASPETNVIWREGGDALVWQQKSPEDWLNERSAQAPGMMLYTSDETPLGNNQATDWHLRVMELAAERGIQLCVMNIAAGVPNPDDWGNARAIIDMLNAHRDLFVMGLREFAGGVITSGVDGGDPTMIQPDQWPTDVSNRQLWHMGRYRNLMGYCKNENIQTPRLVVTHHGMEYMADIGNWMNSLAVTPPFDSVRGWQSLAHQWMSEVWFGGDEPQFESAQIAYAEQLKWANNVLYEPFGAVEAQMIYAWGSAGQAENSLDVSQAFDFQKNIEAYALTQPDYTGYIGSLNNEAIAALSGKDRRVITRGFQRALDAEFLDQNTAAALKRWIGILGG